MAPVCLAACLSLSVWLVFVVFLVLGTRQVESLLTYDQQTLLELRHKVRFVINFNNGGHKTSSLPLRGIPAYLLWTPNLPPPRKRPRRRGKRSGLQVRFKAYLATTSSVSFASWTRRGTLLSFSVPQRFLDPVASCLVPVACLDERSLPLRPCSPRLRQRGLNLWNLATLQRGARIPDALVAPPARIGLVNARSLANKAFILRDFFCSRSLDFLCVTETWISDG